MKTFVLSVLGVVVLAMSLVGVSKTYSYWRATRQLASDQLEENVPMPLEQARAKAMAQQEAQNIFGYEDKVLDLAARGDSAARQAADLSARLDREKQVLAQAKTLLEKPAATYVIGGRSFSQADVSRDALRRLDTCRDLQEQLQSTQALQADLQKAVQQGQSTLAVARRRHDQLSTRLEQLDARHANAEAMQEVATLTGSLSSNPLGDGSELQQVVSNIDRRVSRMERHAVAATDTGTIDYSGTTAADGTADRIGQFLGISTVPTTRPAEAAF